LSYRDTHTLTQDQYADYLRDGVVRLPGFLPQSLVGPAQAAVFAALEQGGFWRNGAWRLENEKPKWPAHGPSASRLIGNKHPELAALFEAEKMRTLVDVLLEGRPADLSVYPRPNTLFSVPNAGEWTLPNQWHTDAPRLASGRPPGVQLFSFFSPVAPRGGGTMVIAGSHRLLNDGRSLTAKSMRHELGHEPYFRQLWRNTPLVWAEGAEYPAGAFENWPLRLVEMTGEPGDLWLMDLRTLHSASQNAAEVPRVMVTRRYVREDVTPEFANAFGWTKDGANGEADDG
jgi:hypothetical protein